MEVIAFNGSPQKDGNTALLIREVLRELETEGMETEMMHLKGPIQGCIACSKCFESQDGRCALDGDVVNDCIVKMEKAVGSYWALPPTLPISRGA